MSTVQTKPHIIKALDQLTIAWQKAEEFLKEICPVLPVEYEIGEDVLSFRKIGSTWRIALLYENEYRPIVDCPTSDRLSFVEHFSGLVEATKKTRDAAASQVAEAAAKLEKIVADETF